MSDEKNTNEGNKPFLKETFKDEQITGKRIWRSLWRMVGKGLVFGIAACLAFCALKPWIEEQFQEEEEAVSISKDEQEEEENIEEEEIEEESLTLTVENYREMNKALYEVAKEARKCTVEIRSAGAETDWKDEDSTVVSVSGVIVWDNGNSILILAPYGDLPQKGEFIVRFADNAEYKAKLKCKDDNLKFGIYTVDRSDITKATLNKIEIAKWGNSYILSKGDPVIALGMQFGYSDGMGYGVISSTKSKVTLADYKYQVMMTDITASSQGSGILFNVDGEVVGIVDQKYTDVSGTGLVSGYSVSEIKAAIELLSNGKGIPYLGIVGVEVTEEISEEEGIPMGIYVKEVEADSPAMEAGIQCGDVIVQMNMTEITSQTRYSKKLMEFSEGDSVVIHIRRQGAEEYESMEFTAIVGNKE